MFVDKKVKVKIIVGSWGEKGKSRIGGDITKIRKTEFTKAMEKIGARGEGLELNDFGIEANGLVIEQILEIVRNEQPDLLVSFDPFDMPYELDHPDHNEIGKAVRWAGAAADVVALGEEAAMEKRPKLWLWSSRKEAKIKLGGREEEKALYWINYYQSQFGAEKKGEIIGLIRRIGENYIELR